MFKEELFLDDYDSTIFFLSLQARVLTVYNIAITIQRFKIPKFQPSRQEIVQEEAVRPTSSVAAV